MHVWLGWWLLVPTRLSQCRRRGLNNCLLSVNLVLLKRVRKHPFNWLAVERIRNLRDSVGNGVRLGAWSKHAEAHFCSLVGSHDRVRSTTLRLATHNERGGARCNKAIKVHREVTG